MKDDNMTANENTTVPRAPRTRIALALACLALSAAPVAWLTTTLIPDSQANEEDTTRTISATQVTNTVPAICGDPTITATLDAQGTRTDGAHWQDRPVTVIASDKAAMATAVLDITVTFPPTAHAIGGTSQDETDGSAPATPDACAAPDGLSLTLTGPAPTDLAGTTLGDPVNLTGTLTPDWHTQILIRGEGMHDPRQLTLTLNAPGSYLDGHQRSVEAALGDDTLITLDNGQTPGRGITLSYAAPDGTPLDTDGTIHTTLDAPRLRATVTDRWFPLHQQTHGDTPLASGTWHEPGKNEPTALQWNENTFTIQTANPAATPDGATTWTATAPLNAAAGQPATPEGAYDCHATPYRGFLDFDRPAATPPTLIVDRTAPQWGDATFNTPTSQTGRWAIAQPGGTLSIPQLTDNASGLDTTRITLTDATGKTPPHPTYTPAGATPGIGSQGTLTIPLGEAGARTDLTAYTLTACDKAGNCATKPLTLAADTTGTTGTTGTTPAQGVAVTRLDTPILSVTYTGCPQTRDGYCNAARTANLTMHDASLDIAITETPQLPIARATHRTTALADGTGASEETLAVTAGDLRPACPEVAPGVSPCPGAYAASIPLSTDGDWTIEASRDNGAGTATFSDAFTIDTASPRLSAVGVEDGRAYNGTVAPRIEASDEHMDGSVEWSLATRSGAVVAEGRAEADAAGQVRIALADIAHDRSRDDVYDLTAQCEDKAGNVSRLHVGFSLNRFGSTYAFTGDVTRLNGSHVPSCGDVTIEETNVSGIDPAASSITVSHDWDATTFNAAPYVHSSTDDKGWSHVTYVLPAMFFASDGYYRVQIASQDKAGNYSSSQMDGVLSGGGSASLAFAVDSAAPAPYISGLSDGAVCERGHATGLIHLRDNMEIASARLVIDGETVDEWDGDDGDGQSVTVPDDGAAHDIILTVTDRAGNTGTAGVYGVSVASAGTGKPRWRGDSPSVSVGSTAQDAPLPASDDAAAGSGRRIPIPVLVGVVIAAVLLMSTAVRWAIRRRRALP